MTFLQWLLNRFTPRKPPPVAELRLRWPTQPNLGVRQIDAAGDGSYGASRDGGARQHIGVDLVCQIGADVVAPCVCEVTHIGVAYAGASLGSIHLKGWDGWHAYTFKLLYVAPEATVGEVLRAGEVLGTSQDVASYYAAKGIHGMTPHVHFEVHTSNGPLNPLTLLEG